MRQHAPDNRNAREETIHLFHHSLHLGGGMERYAVTLIAALRAQGRKVVFHTRTADTELATRLGVGLDLLPVAAFPRKLQDYRFFRRVEGMRRQLSGIQIALTRVCAADVVICGGTHRGYLQCARKVSGFFDWLQIWMERQAYASATCVVSHSDLCAQELARLYSIPSAKVVTLYPPVEAKFCPPRDDAERAAIRRRLGWPSDKIILLFPSMGHRRKGLEPICRALRDVHEPFLLAVAGKPANRSAWPFLRSLGFVENMVAAYRAADFSILGSYYEPFGLVGPESLLCGTRLIFEENIGCLTALNPEFVFRFSVWNPDSIRQAVGKAIALAKSNAHRLTRSTDALRYDPSPDAHALALLHCAGMSRSDV